MKYCNYCGKQIDDDSIYCSHCGMELHTEKTGNRSIEQYCAKAVSVAETTLEKAKSAVKSLYRLVFRKSVLRYIIVAIVMSVVWGILMIVLYEVFDSYSYYEEYCYAISTFLIVCLLLCYIRRDVCNKIARRILAISAVCSFLIGGIVAYVGYMDYYKHEYLPRKEFYRIYHEIEDRFNNEKNIDVKVRYASDILFRTGWEDYYLPEFDYKNNGYSKYELLKQLYDNYRYDAFGCLESNAFSGNPTAQFYLGRCYDLGKYYDKTNYYWNSENNDVKAAYWFLEAAKQGVPAAMNYIGIHYKEGKGVEKNIQKAVYWLKKGAEAGDVLAQFNYGNLFVKGIRIKTGTHKEVCTTTDYIYNKDILIKSVWDDNRNCDVYYYWGYVDDYLTLIPTDIEQAKDWWRKAANQGCEEAKDSLQKIY